MPSDYKQIKEENIKRYGTESDELGHFLAELLYGDPTHFIYELLQNAEDAKATEVEFRLYRDRLELEHNGRAFNEADVQGICALIRGTKKEDLTKIGKFGIGFKSVYAHTQSPEIHSNDEHFAIDKYVQPRSVCPKSSKLGTLFVFPFDHREKDSAKSFSEISRRLNDLGLRTLLFLKHIKSISYDIGEETPGTYLKQTSPLQADFVTDVTMIGQNNLRDEEERWLVFEKDVTHLVHSIPKGKRFTVQIAFLRSDNDSQDIPVVQRLSQSHLTVFFPTKTETYLGFLVQGPYATTASRDSISESDDFNIDLAEQTGDLVIEALRWLRARNWLTVGVLRTMPLESKSFSDTLFDPIYNKVLTTIRDEALIPAYEGGYVSGKNAKLARGKALHDLLDNARLQLFCASDDQLRWISDEIPSNRTDDLRSYFTGTLGIEEIGPERLARGIGKDFLSCQPDDWMHEFYKFASEHKSIISTLKNKSIIRLQDDSHAVPSVGYDQPNAYLPTEHDSQFPTVKREVCDSEEALKFLQKLGLKEPDIVDEVRELILPKYRQDGEVDIVDIDGDEHRQDISVIMKALNEAPRNKRNKLIQDLKQTPFLLTINSEDVKEFRCPDKIYQRTSELEIYFEGNPDAWFLSPEYEPYVNDFEEIGIVDRVPVLCREPSWDGYVRLVRSYGYHVRGINGFDPDCSIKGLKFALTHPNIERAKFIWNHLLMPRWRYIVGTVETSSRQDFSRMGERHSIEVQESKMGKLVREMAWLPNGKGDFVVPAEITLDELPDDFTKDVQLANKLGMQPSELSEDRIRVTDREELLRQIINIVTELAQNSPEKLDEIMDFIQALF